VSGESPVSSGLNHRAFCSIWDDGRCTCGHGLLSSERSSVAPGEGTWAVFAEKAVAERDEARAALVEVRQAWIRDADEITRLARERDELRAKLEQETALRVMAEKFHDVAVRERDFFKVRLAHAEADAEQAVATLTTLQKEDAATLRKASHLLRCAADLSYVHPTRSDDEEKGAADSLDAIANRLEVQT